MKIVILDGYTLNPGDLNYTQFSEFGETVIYDYTAKEDIVERIGEAEIVIVNKTPITREVIDQCPNIAYIGILATGYDKVDVAYCKEKGIVVSNVPSYGTETVAQYTFALLLELCHQVGLHNSCVQNGEWAANRDFCFWKTPQMELAGKTLGIIGFGMIGKAVGKIADAFGMKVLVYARHPKVQDVTYPYEYVSLDELYGKSDVISLHCPLNEESSQMIDQTAITKMKDGALLINTARGGLIQEVDLKEALNCGKIAGAAVDVVSAEPMAKDNPLREAKNIIITPHMAWASLDARKRLLKTSLDNIEAFLEKKPINRVS